MGIFNFFKRLLGYVPDGDDTEIEDSMPYEDENNSTLVYTDEPNLGVDVSDSLNGPARYNAAKLNAIRNAEVAAISNNTTVPGQVARPRPRGQGIRPRQAPPQPVQAPPAQQPLPAPQEQMAPPPQYPAQQYQQYQYPAQYPAQQYQPYPQQYYMQQPQQIPVQGPTTEPDDPNSPIKRFPPSNGEPYTEMIMSNGVYHFFIDLPGVKPEDIVAKYTNMYLFISGTRKLNADLMMVKPKGRGSKGRKNPNAEFEAQITIPKQLENFSYSFYFPKPIASDMIKSSLLNGVLHVEMPVLDPSTGGGGISIQVG